MALNIRVDALVRNSRCPLKGCVDCGRESVVVRVGSRIGKPELVGDGADPRDTLDGVDRCDALVQGAGRRRGCGAKVPPMRGTFDPVLRPCAAVR